MNSFEGCRAIEARGMDDILVFLDRFAYNGQIVITDKGNISEFLQRTVGDVIFNHVKDKAVWCVECKVEQENIHQNFFLEIWSNRSRWKHGWMFTLQTDLLLYYFLKERELFVIPFDRLKGWAFVSESLTRGRGCLGRIWDHPQREQKKHNQLNDTWGCCVPIEVIRSQVGFKQFILGQEIQEAQQPEKRIQKSLLSGITG